MREVVIVEGVRSAFGKRGGGMKELAGSEIAAQVIQGLVERTNILERGRVDDVFMGSAVEDPRTMFLPRYTSQLAGLPFDISATYVEMQCGSAITAINHAAWKILMGMSDIAIVGGSDWLWSWCCSVDRLIWGWTDAGWDSGWDTVSSASLGVIWKIVWNCVVMSIV